MDYKVMGENIKYIRRSSKLTQEELSEMIDVSTVFISQIENGARKPSLETVYKLSIALNTTMDDLVKSHDITLFEKHTPQIDSLLNGRTKEEINLIASVVRLILNSIEQNTLY